MDMLPDVVEAADGMPVLFDSGVRSGTDAVKALALGATAVGVGRSYAYALALGGEDGLVHYITGGARRGRPADGHRRLPDDRRPASRVDPPRGVIDLPGAAAGAPCSHGADARALEEGTDASSRSSPSAASG